MYDDLFLKALEGAIVKAFFEGHTVYDENGCQRTVGGQFNVVVDAALQRMDFEAMAKEIAKRIEVDKKEELLKLASEKFPRLIFKDDWNTEIRPEIIKEMGKVITGIISKSPAFVRSIEKLIDTKNYDVNIKVTVTKKDGKR